LLVIIGRVIIMVMFSGGRRRINFLRIIAIIAGITLLCVLACWFIFDFLKSAEMSILITPSDSEIRVNGSRYVNGNYKMYPGDYEVEISREGFETQSFTVKLEANKAELVHGWLKPTDGSMQIYMTSADDFNILKLVANGDEDAVKAVNDIEKKKRITDFLPFYDAIEEHRGKNVKVSNGTSDDECKEVVCIIVETGAKEESAYKYIKNYFNMRGYNLDDYKIIYRKG